MSTWKIPPIEPWKEAMAQYKYVLLVICVGLALLLLPNQESDTNYSETTVLHTEKTYDLREFEAHLAEHLSLIYGAGNTQVVLTLKNDGEKIYAQDIQIESQGKHNTETVVIGTGSSEKVVEVQQFYPEFQGALIISSGGDNATVQLQLIKAVSALTGLRSDNITVCKSIK